MSTDSVLNEDTKSTSLPADMTDDSCAFKYIEIVPLTRNTDGACTTECDSGDWSAQVKQENLPVVKQEPQDVCYIGYMFFYINLLVFMVESKLFYLVLLSIIILIHSSNQEVLCFTSVPRPLISHTSSV